MTQPQSRTIVHWTFQFGSDVLSCGVEGDGSTYNLFVIPNGRVDTAVVETFASSATALRRHAALVARLRDHGWTLIGYSGRTGSRRQMHQHAAA